MSIRERYGAPWTAAPLKGIVTRNHEPHNWGVEGGDWRLYVASYCTPDDAILIANAPDMADYIERRAAAGDEEAARIMRALAGPKAEHDAI